MQPKKKPLQTQSTSLKSLYRQEAKTEVEHFLVTIHFDSPEIRGCTDPDKAEVWNALIEVLGKWRKYVGCGKVEREQLELEAAYLITNFPRLTIAEIDWMIELYSRRQLPCIYPNFVQFSPAYMSEVIQGFVIVRGEATIRLADAVKRRQAELKVTPAEKADNMRYMVRQVAGQLEKEAGTVWMLGTVYEFLVRTRKLPEQIMVSEGCRKWVTHQLKTRSMKRAASGISLKEMLTGPPAGDIKKATLELTRQYILTEYFTTHPVEKVCAAIKEKDFL